jgi:hypothetical protein
LGTLSANIITLFSLVVVVLMPGPARPSRRGAGVSTMRNYNRFSVSCGKTWMLLLPSHVMPIIAIPRLALYFAHSTFFAGPGQTTSPSRPLCQPIVTVRHADHRWLGSCTSYSKFPIIYRYLNSNKMSMPSSQPNPWIEALWLMHQKTSLD